MKTSIKLITAAFLLIVISLSGYDYLLKETYVSGTYKNPYVNFVELKYRDFDEADLVSSTALNVKFVQGPFSVRIDKYALDYAIIKQTGRTLQIKADFERDYFYNTDPYMIVVSCPRLKQVKASAVYTQKNKKITDTVAREDWQMRNVLIAGFRQDSISIIQDYGSEIILADNDIGTINAVTGKSRNSGSILIIQKSNSFGKTNFDVRNRSQLLLNNTSLGDLNYQLADSARLVLTGSAQNLLKK